MKCSNYQFKLGTLGEKPVIFQKIFSMWLEKPMGDQLTTGNVGKSQTFLKYFSNIGSNKTLEQGVHVCSMAMSVQNSLSQEKN